MKKFPLDGQTSWAQMVLKAGQFAGQFNETPETLVDFGAAS